MRLLYIKSGKVKLSFVSNLNYIFLLLFAKLDKGEASQEKCLIATSCFGTNLGSQVGLQKLVLPIRGWTLCQSYLELNTLKFFPISLN